MATFYSDQELKETGRLVVEEMRKNRLLTLSQVARNIDKPLDAVKDAIMTHLPTIKGESNDGKHNIKDVHVQ